MQSSKGRSLLGNGDITRKPANRPIGIVLVVSAGIFWSTMGLFVRPLSAYGFGSIEIAAARLFFTALVFSILLTVKDRAGWRIHLRDLPLFVGLGVASVAFFTVCYYISIQMMSLSTAAILLYTSPIWVMLMSVLFFKEKVTSRKMAALVMAFCGCVLVSGVGGSVTPLGFVIGLGSGIGYALYSILGTVALRKYSSLTVTTYTMLFAAVATILVGDKSQIFAILLDPAAAAPLAGATGAAATDAIAAALASTPALVAFFILMAVVTGVAPYQLYTMGLEHVEASRAAIMATVEPIFATIIGTLVLGEALTPLSLLGIVCVVGAIVVLNTQGRVRQRAAQTR